MGSAISTLPHRLIVLVLKHQLAFCKTFFFTNVPNDRELTDLTYSYKHIILLQISYLWIFKIKLIFIESYRTIVIYCICSIAILQKKHAFPEIDMHPIYLGLWEPERSIMKAVWPGRTLSPQSPGQDIVPPSNSFTLDM